MAEAPLISGVQQIGIGCKDVDTTWKWYRQMLGFDVALFDDSAEAAFMTPYTGGQVHSRRALLALNMSGGGGLEIWQFKSRTPAELPFEPVPGDLGIYAVKFKSAYLERSQSWLRKSEGGSVSALTDLPGGKGFWGMDPFGNAFQVTEDNSWFKSDARPAGGVLGAVIGVSDMETAIKFYRTLLGDTEVTFDATGKFDDLPAGSDRKFRRVILNKKETAHGAFSHLLGNIQLELLQDLEGKPRKLFAARYWGDCGFIHLCFDTLDMNTLKQKLEKNQYPFTIDSGESFGMESAAGRFAYVEDPDGTLIELVETHKLPILKKIGWYLDLRKRKHQRPLPNWMLGLLGLGREKD